jgi:hypothetical protein
MITAEWLTRHGFECVETRMGCFTWRKAGR